jgi:hypothetical protein
MFIINASIPKEISSMISHIQWSQQNREEDGSLLVTFRPNGAKYIYEKVDMPMVFNLLSADSIGKYFNAKIKTAFLNTKVKEQE